MKNYELMGTQTCWDARGQVLDDHIEKPLYDRREDNLHEKILRDLCRDSIGDCSQFVYLLA
jgi:hypothetical protein